MRVGRAKFRAGDVDLAVHIWTKALESAYAAQDVAAMFVLSKNLGDAFAVQARAAVDGDDEATAALQKSVDYYTYALNVIDECALRDVLANERHLVLNRSAGHIQTKLARLRVLQEKQQQHKAVVAAQRTAKAEPIVDSQPCTTCEERFEHLVLDESDGCLYCQACYDAFYASGGSTEAVASALSSDADTDTAAVDDTPCSSGVRIEHTSQSAERARDAGPSSPPPVCAVELSLLAQTEEDKRVNAVATDSALSAAIDAADADADADASSSALDLPAQLQPQSVESHAAAVGDDDKQAPTLALALAAAPGPSTAHKQAYSIAELLSLRPRASNACPPALLASPVSRLSGSASHASTGARSSRKMSGKSQQQQHAVAATRYE